MHGIGNGSLSRLAGLTRIGRRFAFGGPVSTSAKYGSSEFCAGRWRASTTIDSSYDDIVEILDGSFECKGYEIFYVMNPSQNLLKFYRNPLSNNTYCCNYGFNICQIRIPIKINISPRKKLTLLKRSGVFISIVDWGFEFSTLFIGTPTTACLRQSGCSLSRQCSAANAIGGIGLAVV